MADEHKGAYGTIHVMEEEMRAAGQGVFEAHPSAKRTARTKAAAPVESTDAAPRKASSKKKG